MINRQLCVAIFYGNAGSTSFCRHHVVFGGDLDPSPFRFRRYNLVRSQLHPRISLGPVSRPLLPTLRDEFRLGPSFLSVDELFELLAFDGVC